MSGRLRELIAGSVVLAGGSVLAQLPQVILAPLIGRRFEPAAFGVFGLFVAWHSVLSVLATLRMEYAIAVPADEASAIGVVRLGLVSGGLVSGLGACAAWLSGGMDWSRALALGLAVMAFSWGQMFSYWRHRRFGFTRVSVARVARGVTLPLAWLLFAGYHGAADALIWGFTVAQIVGVLTLFDPSVGFVTGLRKLSLSATLSRFRRFPTLSLPAGLASALTQQAPLLVLNQFFGVEAGGAYVFAQRYFSAPVGIVTTALADVFKQHAARELRDHNTLVDSWEALRKVLGPVILLCIPVTCGLAPFAFPLIFGDEWRVAGLFVAVMAPMVFVGLFVGPFSRVVYLRERQDLDLGWQLGLGILGVAALLAGRHLGTPTAALAAFSGTYTLMYWLYWRVLRHIAFGRPPHSQTLTQTAPTTTQLRDGQSDSH